MARKRQNRYHHGDLSRALVEEAVRTIQKSGVEGLTLRAVGQRLGVSRTALYRHFADKSALLAAVASQGFRTLRLDLQAAWDQHGRGDAGFEAMGAAYVHFAVAHPSYYRVMFGGSLGGMQSDSDVSREGGAAFQVLVDAVVELQQQGSMSDDSPLELAQYIWAIVHGIAMLAIDGLLRQPVDEVIRYAVGRIRTGV